MEEENGEGEPIVVSIASGQQQTQNREHDFLPLDLPALLTIPSFRMKPPSTIINTTIDGIPSTIRTASDRSHSLRSSTPISISNSTRSQSNPFSESTLALLRSSVYTVDVPTDDYSVMMMMNDSIPSGVFPDVSASATSTSSRVKPYGIFSSSARNNTNPMLACSRSSSISSQNNPLLMSTSRASLMSFEIDALMDGIDNMGMSMNFIEEGEEEEVH
jgi:hypothetical protein